MVCLHICSDSKRELWMFSHDFQISQCKNWEKWHDRQNAVYVIEPLIEFWKRELISKKINDHHEDKFAINNVIPSQPHQDADKIFKKYFQLRFFNIFESFFCYKVISQQTVWILINGKLQTLERIQIFNNPYLPSPNWISESWNGPISIAYLNFPAILTPTSVLTCCRWKRVQHCGAWTVIPWIRYRPSPVAPLLIRNSDSRVVTDEKQVISTNKA